MNGNALQNFAKSLKAFQITSESYRALQIIAKIPEAFQTTKEIHRSKKSHKTFASSPKLYKVLKILRLPKPTEVF